MAAIDNLVSSFFNELITLRWDIEDYTSWMKKYESQRYKYPEWITKSGKHIKIYDLEDSHLDNLISFVAKKDKENKTHWIDVLKSEQRYRKLKSTVYDMQDKLAVMESIEDTVY